MLATTSGIAIDGVVDESTDTDRPARAVSSLLLARGIEGAYLALALADVRRLERFASATIERHGGVDVVRYREGILPLLWVDDVLSGREPPAAATLDDTFEAVVCDSSVGAIGLVVGRIEDIVDEPVIPSQPPSRRGVVASFIVDDRVAELVDLETLIADAGLVTTA
jgi:two-component system chemotaxis sensor kinase CheA